MAHYEGETLKERIERGPLPLDDAVDIATQVGQGLAEAHKAGIVHRDIKPANLLVTKTGVVKIFDFGLAKLAGAEGMTQTGTTMGTVAYMSPEQASGGVSQAQMAARGTQLRNLPEEVRRERRTRNRGAVAQDRDHRVRELHGIVQRVAEAMRRVEQRQHTQPEKDEPGERVPEHGQHVLVGGRWNPAKRKRDAEQQQERRHQHRRKHAAGAEEQPQIGLGVLSDHLCPQ